jgi:hypothetical protein
MHILRPPTSPAPPAPAPSPTTAGTGAGALACRVRRADGRVFTGALPAARHRALQLGLLHADSAGLVELTPGTRRADGRLELDRRRHPEHFLPGGASGQADWLRALLAHAQLIIAGSYATARPGERPGEEAFVGVAPRERAAGTRDAVAGTRWLWIDVDRPDRLDALWALLAERPCQLLIESGGSGGVHAYWQLAEPLPARWTGPDGRVSEPIERAHGRIIRALGVDDTGRPDVADPRCAERSRVMRLAGTINHKSGAWARVLEADLALEPYTIEGLVGDLHDSVSVASRPRCATDSERPHDDPYKRIAPPEYFRRLAGITVPRGGLVTCPVPRHRDRHPSCSVGTSPEQGWCCHSSGCGARGAIYDLASVLDGGPWGAALRGAAFARARARVTQAFGERR